MASQDDALAALKTLLASLDVSPAPAGVWHYPNDYADMASVGYSKLPLVICYDIVNTPDSWGRFQDGLGLHSWSIGISCLLYPGDITTMKSAVPAEMSHKGWVKALADLLLANQTLNGTALYIGDADLPATLGEGGIVSGGVSQLFQARIGGIGGWFDRNFWGVEIALPILQVHGQAMGG